MGTRRLLIVMLVLLGTAALSVALLPNRPVDDDETESTAEKTETAPPDPTPEGKALGATIEVGGEQVPVVKPVEVGDQLSLTVKCKCFDAVEIPALDAIGNVTPDSPVRFDLLPPAAGSYGIRLTGADRVVARIEVQPRDDGAKSRAREE